MTKFQCDEGVITSNDVTSSVVFNAVFGFVDNALLPNARRYFDGHISYVAPDATLMRVIEEAHIRVNDKNVFTIAGRVGNSKTWFGDLTCKNCYFTWTTIMPEGEANKLAPCDLSFNVVNPNEDVKFKFLVDMYGVQG